MKESEPLQPLQLLPPILLPSNEAAGRTSHPPSPVRVTSGPTSVCGGTDGCFLPKKKDGRSSPQIEVFVQ